MKYILTIIILSFLLAACSDTFSTVLEIDPPEFEQQLVVGSFINSGETSTEFFTGTNRGIFDNSDFEEYKVDDAKIFITKEESGQTFSLEEHGEKTPELRTNYRIYVPMTFYEPNHDYTFRVQHPVYPESVTTLRIPGIGQIENIVYKYEDGLLEAEENDVFEENVDASSISFDIVDEPGVENYYELGIRTQLFRFRLSSIDPSVDNGANSRDLSFSDQTFDGEIKRIKVKFNRNEYDPASGEEISFHWDSVNKGYHNFNKSIERQGEIEDNPFVTPVPVYSNLNNALGTIGFRVRNTIKFTP